jgi:hypothetical protein
MLSLLEAKIFTGSSTLPNSADGKEKMFKPLY